MLYEGFYEELWPGGPSVYEGSIVSQIDAAPHSDFPKVSAYLASGVPVLDVMEAERDVFNRDCLITGGSSLLTDGVWVWRKDLRHYLAEHSLRLSEDFLKYFRSNSYIVPDVPLEQMKAIIADVTQNAW